jgi:SPP1 family predicted phage head-tail adaptor
MIGDGFGQEVLTWTTAVTAWAMIQPALGSEQVVGAADVASVTHSVFIRYRPNIVARMRLLYGARIFEIVSVIDVDERHFWLQLQCSEGLTQG